MSSPISRLRRLGTVLLAVGLVLAATPAVATSGRPNPRLARPDSRLHRPWQEPVFLLGHVGFGGAFRFDQGLPDYGASLVFRPGSAADFLDVLYRLETSLVLRIDAQRLTTEGDRLVSGDFILRRHFADRGDERTEVRPFVGVGFGATDVTVPAEAGGGNSRYWSWLVEAGQEWWFRPDILVVARVQYRHQGFAGFHVSTWTVSGGVGVPLPW